MMNIEKLFNRMGYAGQLGKLGTVIRVLADKVEKKVEKEDGKGLSSNDFTDEYKAYLDNLMQNEE